MTSKTGLAFAMVAAFALIAPRADASAPDDSWTIAFAPVLSIQPDGYSGWPYLSKPLGGTALGLALAAERRVTAGAGLALEVSSTLAIKDDQTGRFIFGRLCYETPGCLTPVTSTHRDTIVSLLGSFALGAAEVKAGTGFARSATHQGDDAFNHYDETRAVLTAGFGVPLPVGSRLTLLPMARYHFVFRGDEKMYGGLSRSVVRLGVGLRFGGR